MQIRKAERRKAKLRLAIYGPTGSGKTWSSLEIATGMGGKIGMIDTESGRGELYANNFEYDVIRLESPYSTERYIQAIKMFEQEGYNTIIIDSLSHAWVGEGGILSVVEKAGSSFNQGWRVGTPKHNSLVDTIMQSKCHVICTLRVKTEYVVEKNDKGKTEPRKIGLAPVQRDQLEYEFLLLLEMSEKTARATKDNTRLFTNEYFTPNFETGRKLIEWLNEGKEPEKIEDKQTEIVGSLRSSKDVEELKKNYLNLIKLYPTYQDMIIQESKKIKEELLINIG